MTKTYPTKERKLRSIKKRKKKRKKKQTIVLQIKCILHATCHRIMQFAKLSLIRAGYVGPCSPWLNALIIFVYFCSTSQCWL